MPRSKKNPTKVRPLANCPNYADQAAAIAAFCLWHVAFKGVHRVVYEELLGQRGKQADVLAQVLYWAVDPVSGGTRLRHEFPTGSGNVFLVKSAADLDVEVAASESVVKAAKKKLESKGILSWESHRSSYHDGGRTSQYTVDFRALVPELAAATARRARDLATTYGERRHHREQAARYAESLVDIEEYLPSDHLPVLHGALVELVAAVDRAISRVHGRQGKPERVAQKVFKLTCERDQYELLARCFEPRSGAETPDKYINSEIGDGEDHLLEGSDHDGSGAERDGGGGMRGVGGEEPESSARPGGGGRAVVDEHDGDGPDGSADVRDPHRTAPDRGAGSKGRRDRAGVARGPGHPTHVVTAALPTALRSAEAAAAGWHQPGSTPISARIGSGVNPVGNPIEMNSQERRVLNVYDGRSRALGTEKALAVAAATGEATYKDPEGAVDRARMKPVKELSRALARPGTTNWIYSTPRGDVLKGSIARVLEADATVDPYRLTLEAVLVLSRYALEPGDWDILPEIAAALAVDRAAATGLVPQRPRVPTSDRRRALAYAEQECPSFDPFDVAKNPVAQIASGLRLRFEGAPELAGVLVSHLKDAGPLNASRLLYEAVRDTATTGAATGAASTTARITAAVYEAHGRLLHHGLAASRAGLVDALGETVQRCSSPEGPLYGKAARLEAVAAVKALRFMPP